MKKLILSLILLLVPSLIYSQTYTARVVDHGQYLSITDLPIAFRRPTDPIAGAVKFLISERGEICLVPDSDFVMVTVNSYYNCKWRRPRGY